MLCCSNVCGSLKSLCSSESTKADDKKVVRIALTILAICAVAVTACALMLHYPAASSAFITTFAVGGVGAFIAFCVAFVRLGKAAPAGHVLGTTTTTDSPTVHGNPFNADDNSKD